MLKDLEDWLADENLRRIKEGEMGLRPVEMKIMGQIALLLGLPNEDLNATSDLDAVIRGDQTVKEFLKTRLLEENLVLDDEAELIQMPKSTKWNEFFSGKFLNVKVAAPEYVAASKSQFHRLKDRTQLKKLFQKFPKWRELTESLEITTDWIDE